MKGNGQAISLFRARIHGIRIAGTLVLLFAVLEIGGATEESSPNFVRAADLRRLCAQALASNPDVGAAMARRPRPALPGRLASRSAGEHGVSQRKLRPLRSKKERLQLDPAGCRGFRPAWGSLQCARSTGAIGGVRSASWRRWLGQALSPRAAAADGASHKVAATAR